MTLPLPLGWNSHYDPLMQRTYYVESATGRTQWEFPHAPAQQPTGHPPHVQPVQALDGSTQYYPVPHTEGHLLQGGCTAPYTSHMGHPYSTYQPQCAATPVPAVSYTYRDDHHFEYHDKEHKRHRQDHKDKHHKSYKEDKDRKDRKESKGSKDGMNGKDGNGEKTEKQRKKEEEDEIWEEVLGEIFF
ncbi:hypothetical protein KVV02_006375 [Mortierella alpina]|uniref:WW domain-containing protein n=1 Tax=Mortierella alpina TaxID=64518 RepID=A0A9P8D352_MORAP|nr:hypothetical protein KVV02_006375 [Mortierella alpina]